MASVSYLKPASPARPNVVIIGAGFGGLYAARALRGAPAQLTILDRHNHHLFQPLLYQVSTAALSPGDIAMPLRAILRKQKNARVLLAEATAVDLASRKVMLRDGEVAYDYLIVAAGAEYNYFGHNDWVERAPGLKTLEDALEIRRRMLLAFEKAEREPDKAMRSGLLTFVIVGGGPTGVEMAGAIAEIARYVMVEDFRAIDPREARIILCEASHLLNMFPPPLASWAEGQLRKIGVEVRTGARVEAIEDGWVQIGEERIPAATVIWAAGVKGVPLGRTLGVPTDRAGRVLIGEDLTVPGHPEVFVIGDLASLTDPRTGKPLPGVAPVAIQQGQHAAANILSAMAGRPLLPFRYKDRGNLATIGRAAAIADFGRLKFTGLLAWTLWLVVHIFWLIGFRNRFVVLFNWAYAYFSFQRAARLITGRIE